MKLIDIIEKIDNISNIEKDKICIFPINVDIKEINPHNLIGNVVYFQENNRIIGSINKNLLIYLQKKNKSYIFFEILDKIEEGVVAIDEKGKIFYVNRAYFKILGVPLYKIIGKYIQHIEKDASILEVLKTRKEIYKMNNYIKSIKKYVNVNISPIFNNGKFKGAISIFTDITEITNLNKEVFRITSVAEEYSKLLIAKEKLENFGIIGEDKKYLEIITKSLAVSETDATILVLGENGVGKDIVSKFIHNNSKRAKEIFIILNCASIPENLIESEMFGYEGGAFTGANKNGKLGKFELADKGTIFLDEIGDMSLAMQAKLLRTLETGEIEKIGSESKKKVDVRIIAATNQNLEKKIKDGEFREDLFYRLSTITLEIPPLRNRGHDIILFIHHFLKYYNSKYNKNCSLSNEVYSNLMEYKWPGNIRELKNCIEHAVILSQENIINIEHLPKKIQRNVPSNTPISLAELLANKEKEILLNELLINNWNLKKIEEKLKISERTLYRKIKKHGINLS